ncbi:hypothetical protein ACKTEK_07910 [Tepidamorphus sp. 3E244]|uniref:hypothetical protein n=1 Tax=Tepidamorphus sp. 3E244 TaxID=3385498 RepID=UPI0038FD3236
MTGSLAFFFCVEPGWLEPQARLLARSIRRSAGRYADTEVHAVQPRGTDPLTPETTDCFAACDVTHHAGRWNTRQANLGTANKVHAAALIETRSEAEILVFLDTDTVVLGEPSELDLHDDEDIAVQLTTRGLGGTTGPSDPLEPYWAACAQACGVELPAMVDTLISRKRVRGYYNGGLVAMRRSAGIGTQWRDVLNRIDPLTHERRRYMDQVSLSLVAAARPERVRILPPTYNYNIRERGQFGSELDTLPLDEIVIAHYHKAFSRPDFLPRVRPALDPQSDAFRWLAPQLPLPPVMKRWRHPVRDRLEKLAGLRRG